MEDLQTIALVVGASMAIIKLLEVSITKFFEYLNGNSAKNNKDADQQTEIAVLKEQITKLEVVIKNLQDKLNKIETNDLAHINAKLDLNLSEHRDLFVELGEIKQILRNK